MFLHRPLPEGVTDIETVLYQRDPNAIQDMPTVCGSKGMGERFLLSKDEPLTPNINGIMAL